MSMSDEYQSLRDELLREYDREGKITSLAFTATAVIIGWGFTSQTPNPIVFLLPLLLLALLLFHLINTLSTILRISVYIRVFIERNKRRGQNWETAISALRQKLRQERRLDPFTEVIFADFTALTGAVCIVLYFIINTSWERNLVTAIVTSLWTVVCFHSFRAIGYRNSGKFAEKVKDDFEEIYELLKKRK